MRSPCSLRDPILLTRTRRTCGADTRTFVTLCPDVLDVRVCSPHPGMPRMVWGTPRTLSVFADAGGIWRWLADVDVPDGYDGLAAECARDGEEIRIRVPATV